MGWEGGRYSKRSCPLVRVALISARSILYNVKKQLWCLIFSTRLHALRVWSFSFRSLFVFLCRSGSQQHSCHSWSFFDDFFDKPVNGRGAQPLEPPRCWEKNDDVVIKQHWRKHGRAALTSYQNYLVFHGGAQRQNRSMCGFVLDASHCKI